MTTYRVPALATATAICLGCSATPPATEPHETVLLVSLADGSVIQQTINLDADICFKANGDAATTCLTRGEPILGGEAETVIGYEMDTSHIALIPK